MQNTKYKKTIIAVIVVVVLIVIYVISKSGSKALAPVENVTQDTDTFLKDIINNSEMLFTISECKYQGESYFSIQPEATGDIPNSLYSSIGENMGYCGGFITQKGRDAQPAICRLVEDCRLIYKPDSEFDEMAPIDLRGLNPAIISSLGNVEDLISFSVKPGDSVSGEVLVSGMIRGGYFFEANMPISILSSDKTILATFGASATTDWMTVEDVSFGTALDFTNIPKGPAYIALTQDDPSGGEGGRIPKQVLIPVVVE